MSSNYDRFKPTSIAQTKERKQEVNNAFYDNENQVGSKFKKMQVKKDGIYTIRMWPAHPVDKALSIEPKVIYFIPGMRKKKDSTGAFIKDNRGNEIFEQYNRPVFDSRIHGKSQFDLCDTYIGLVKKQAEKLYLDNKEGQKSYLAPLMGNKFQGGAFNGIQPLKSYIFYGELITGDGERQKKEFFEFEVGKAIEKGIQNTAAIENDNDPLGTDGCFTDPEDGLPMKIIVDAQGSKAANDPSLYYKVSLVKETEKQNVNGRMQPVVKQYPITEEELDWYEKEIVDLTAYRSVFTRRDLEIQLKGLQMFDEEHKFNVIESDEFKDVWNFNDKFFPQTEESNSESTSSGSKGGSEDEFDLMNIVELKSFIKSEKLGIVVLPSMTDLQIREMIRLTLSEEVSDKEEEDETESEENDQAETSRSSAASSYKDRIANLGKK